MTLFLDVTFKKTIAPGFSILTAFIMFYRMEDMGSTISVTPTLSTQSPWD